MKHISVFLDEAFNEMFEERSDIREFDGKQSREEAEKHAAIEADKLRADCRKEWAKRREVA